MKTLLHIIAFILMTAAAPALLATSHTVTPAPSHSDARGSYYLSGIVRDSVTLEPLPYASVTIGGSAAGTLTNDNGIFEITVPNNATELHVSCLGFERKTVKIAKKSVNTYDVQLVPVATELKEVVVRKQKYSKKNNPAVDFAKALKDKGPLTDPERNDYYSYDKYQIITFALNDFANKKENSWIFKKMPFLWDHVDTSEISGKPILNVMVKEKASTVNYRKEPRSKKETVRGVRQEGIDDIADKDAMNVFLEDVLREIDLYQNDITLMQNRFVSPLSKIAPDFYKFYLTDTVEVDSEKCIVLSFYPHNTSSFGFNGQVFVPLNDSTMFIKKVTMRTPRNINLNFIDNLFISQEFDRAPDGSRLKTRDDLTVEMQIVPGTPSFYMRRNVGYDNFSFERPDDEEMFSKLGDEIPTDSMRDKTEEFWTEARIIPVSHNETGVDRLMKSMRSVPLYYWTEKFIKIMFTGYVPTGKPSKFDYGPVNTTLSYSSVGGWRIRVGGMTTANLSKHWFARGFVAYGTRDHVLKYRGELEYSFNEKLYHSREFPIHSIRATSLYDINHIGEKYAFTNMDNMFLSLKRMKDIEATYHRLHQLEYNLELRNNFSINATIRNELQEPSDSMPFIDGYGKHLKNYTENTLQVQLRYAPGEKFYQTKTHRMPVNLDAPTFILTHTFGPKGWFGSTYALNMTELTIMKRFWFSAFGYTDLILKGGHVWSRSPFPNLLIPNANLSYTIQPESYACLNPMEFVNDSYASWDITYWANGAIFNYVPLFKKLKMREVVTFKGWWGKLSKRNDPLYNPDLLQFPRAANVTRMTNTPYMEISAGIDNIFRCLRVDYVWRLTYLDVPYYIDRRGLRISLHATF